MACWQATLFDQTRNVSGASVANVALQYASRTCMFGLDFFFYWKFLRFINLFN